MRESCLVVNHENNHHIIAFEDAADGGSIEYCAFHFAAVYAGVSGEVHQYGFSFGGSCCHALLVVVVVAEFAAVEVEVLSVQRRSEGAHCLKRGAPESGYQIYRESQRCQRQEEAAHGSVVRG